MIKQINRVLKLVGLNLVRAKSPRRKVFKLDEIPYDASKHMGEVEWQGVPKAIKVPTDSLPPVNPEWRTSPNTGNEGRTHYVGDNCPGGHRVGTENCCIGPEAKVFVGNPNANFVPVDIGSDDHEMTRVEQKAQQAFEKCCGLDSHPYRVDEIPRVEKPNSDNKTTS